QAPRRRPALGTRRVLIRRLPRAAGAGQHTMTRGALVTLLAWGWLSMLCLPTSWAAPPVPALFDARPAGVRALAPRTSPTATIRRRAATPRLDVLVHADGSPALAAGDRVELNLFDDARFSMAVADVARHAGGLTWSGALDGVDLGHAILSLYDGALV